MDMSKYKGMFIEEAREHLKTINDLLLSLEKIPDDQPAINNLFREYHSVKGMAASMGYDPIMKISHSMEDLLDEVKKQEIPVPGSALSLLFSGTDLLENMIEEIAADQEISDPGAEVMNKIREAETQLKGTPATSPIINDVEDVSEAQIVQDDDVLEVDVIEDIDEIQEIEEIDEIEIEPSADEPEPKIKKKRRRPE